MGFINASLDQDYEDRPVPEGEYNLRITKVDEEESKAGNAMLVLQIKVEDRGFPNAAPIRHWVVLPDGSDPQKDRLRSRDLKRLLYVFGVNVGPKGFDSDDLQGATGSCMVTQEEGTDDKGKSTGDIYNRLRLPRLND